ncbi:MAG: hypothetical protein QXL14_02165 [Candidatus Aenigmatarchaeota archaeon]
MKLSVFLPLFLLLNVAFADILKAGSSYFFDFPKCEKLNVTFICEERIEDSEFVLNDCFEYIISGFERKYVCDCFDGYVLNLTINKASKNFCTIFFTWVYKIYAERQVETRIYTGGITQIYNTTNVTNITKYEIKEERCSIGNISADVITEIEKTKILIAEEGEKTKNILILSFLALIIIFIIYKYLEKKMKI